jgi:hypothetical protein
VFKETPFFPPGHPGFELQAVNFFSLLSILNHYFVSQKQPI